MLPTSLSFLLLQRKTASQQTHKLYAAKDNPVSSEMFVALVTERLLAVEKDRKAMEQRVRDDARQMGRSFGEIMVSVTVYICTVLCLNCPWWNLASVGGIFWNNV